MLMVLQPCRCLSRHQRVNACWRASVKCPTLGLSSFGVIPALIERFARALSGKPIVSDFEETAAVSFSGSSFSLQHGLRPLLARYCADPSGRYGSRLHARPQN